MQSIPPWKWIIAVIWDFLDFTLFRIPGFGTIADVLSIPLAIMLWGNIGIIAAWEIADITDQLDAEIPTMTLLGVYTLVRK